MLAMPSTAHVPTPPASPRGYGLFFAAMPGLLLGTAVQLQQPVLFQAHIYLLLVLVAPV